MKCTCLVCSQENEGKICLECGFESKYYIGEVSKEEKEEQQLKIKIARRNWQELQYVKKRINQVELLLKNVQEDIQSLQKEIKFFKQNKNDQDKQTDDFVNFNQTEVIQAKKYSLRSKPIKTEAPGEDFGLYENNKPIVYIQNQYKDNADGTITDYATGLMWQQDGAKSNMRYDNIKNYIQIVNRHGIAGYNDWRLPTIDELISILEPDIQSGQYIQPIFESKRDYYWSSDEATKGKMYMIDFDKRMVLAYPYHGNSYVRLVRSI